MLGRDYLQGLTGVYDQVALPGYFPWNHVFRPHLDLPRPVWRHNWAPATRRADERGRGGALQGSLGCNGQVRDGEEAQ